MIFRMTLVQLPRVLGPWMATAIVVGTVIGTGVFKKGRNVATNVPEFGLGISVWIIGGLLTLLGALALAEVAVRLPRAGGNYVFLREGFGRRAGFLWGWVEFWIIRSASIAALASMFTDSLHEIIKDVKYPHELIKPDVVSYWPRQAFTIFLIAVLSVVNILGTRIGATLQLVITALKVLSIIAIALLPFIVLAVVGTPEFPPRTEFLKPTWPADWSNVNWGNYGVALVAVFWAYDGWMNIGPVAEEVRNPSRNLPLALLAGVLLLITLYVSANVSYYLVIPHNDIISVGSTPLATVFCSRLLGNAGILIASLILMTSVFGALNGNVLIAPRLLFAMGRDDLASPRLSALHPKYQTPAAGTIAFGVWSCALIVIGGLLTQFRLPLMSLGGHSFDINLPEGKELFDVMTDYAMVGTITMGTLAVAAIFPLRTRDPGTSLPYRCIGYPVVPIIYVTAMAAVQINMFLQVETRTESIIGTAFLALGAVVYQILFVPKRR
ncbi:amino acid permease [soil metagenome]